MSYCSLAVFSARAAFHLWPIADVSLLMEADHRVEETRSFKSYNRAVFSQSFPKTRQRITLEVFQSKIIHAIASLMSLLQAVTSASTEPFAWRKGIKLTIRSNTLVPQ